jgi:hypothetical protein
LGLGPRARFRPARDTNHANADIEFTSVIAADRPRSATGRRSSRLAAASRPPLVGPWTRGQNN